MDLPVYQKPAGSAGNLFRHPSDRHKYLKSSGHIASYYGAPNTTVQLDLL